ncbi:hypothetical protein PR048_024102 [Dryococelus australis]|uniref:Uncharacterized protein n=1 Tax=Dryococelus australis TaxID=614101 RepID=A0ABQ9GVY6_9NEOP|nr:hypothetical protein PR048_024102 [Dryococelus australis]
MRIRETRPSLQPDYIYEHVYYTLRSSWETIDACGKKKINSNDLATLINHIHITDIGQTIRTIVFNISSKPRRSCMGKRQLNHFDDSFCNRQYFANAEDTSLFLLFNSHAITKLNLMRVIEMSKERRWNEGAGETGHPRENPPTNGIVQHDSHLRKSTDLQEDKTRIPYCQMWSNTRLAANEQTSEKIHTCTTRSPGWSNDFVGVVLEADKAMMGPRTGDEYRFTSLYGVFSVETATCGVNASLGVNVIHQGYKDEAGRFLTTDTSTGYPSIPCTNPDLIPTTYDTACRCELRDVAIGLPRQVAYLTGALRRLFESMRVIEVSMEQRRNEGAEETGDPRENPPTSSIVRHDSHLRKSGDPAGD